MRTNHFFFAILGALLFLGKCNPHHGQTLTPSSELIGTWKGAMSNPHMRAPMELVIARDGDVWGAYVTIPSENGPRTHNLKDFKINGAEISFSAEIHEIPIVFSGKLQGSELTGDFDGKRDGMGMSGTWKLSR